MDAREAIAKLTEKLCDMEYQALGRDYTRDELATMAGIEGAIAAREKETPAQGPREQPGAAPRGRSPTPRRPYPAPLGCVSKRTSRASFPRGSTIRAAQRAAAWAVCKRI